MVDEQKYRVQKSFEAEHRGLLAFVRSKIKSLEESEDLLQEVYVQALIHLNVLEAVDNLTGWLYTAAKNKVIDWYRKKNFRQKFFAEKEDKQGQSTAEAITE